MGEAHRWRDLLDPGRATDFFEVDGTPPSFAPTGGFDAGTAWWCSELSRAIYRRDGRAAFLLRAGLRERRFFDRGSTQAALVEGPGFVALVFRGSADARDWLTNLRVSSEPVAGGGRAHQGFVRGLDAVWEEAGRALDELAGGAAAFVTGHSLGGALATIAATRRPFAAAYTFGAPRVGDAGFWRTLRGPLHRVVTEEDAVPHLPPRHLGYAHGGDEHLLPAPRSPRDRGRFGPHAALGAHAPAVYSARLRP